MANELILPNRVPLLRLDNSAASSVPDQQRWDKRHEELQAALSVPLDAMQSHMARGRILSSARVCDIDMARILREVQPGEQVLVLPKFLKDLPSPAALASLAGRVDTGSVTVVTNYSVDKGEIFRNLWDLLAKTRHLRTDDGLKEPDPLTLSLRHFPRAFAVDLQAFVKNNWFGRQKDKSLDGISVAGIRSCLESFYRDYNIRHVSGRLPDVLGALPDGSVDAVISFDRMHPQALADVQKPVFFDHLQRLTRPNGRWVFRETTAKGLTKVEYYLAIMLGGRFSRFELRDIKEPFWCGYMKVARGNGLVAAPRLLENATRVPITEKDPSQAQKDAVAEFVLGRIGPVMGNLGAEQQGMVETEQLVRQEISLRSLREAGLLGAFVHGFQADWRRLVEYALSTSAKP